MRKLTKAEAGKLGSIKTNKIQKEKKLARIDEYNESPALCKECDTTLSYEKRTNKFCSSSCAATHNNKKRESKVEYFNCVHCGTEKEKHRASTNTYCSIACQHEAQHIKRVESWKAGDTFSKLSVKRYLSEQQEGCWCCGITEWQGKGIVLELEHIDGDSSNNKEENLSLLCPNCHSQTKTYKGKNRGNGRHARRQRYAEGKSF